MFDPNAAASANSGIFGLPTSEDEAAFVYVPVPWEATTSYRGGTSNGPRAILEASRQVDLFDLDVERPYEAGLFMRPESENVRAWNAQAKEAAQRVIGERGTDADTALVNELGKKVNDFVRDQTKALLGRGKLVGIVGGDHSVPFGAFEALGERMAFGILHIDAHSDTRRAYEGFTYSHASIMFNVLENIPAVTHLVQVGIRDVCEEEMNYVRERSSRARMFTDRDVSMRKLEGGSFAQVAHEIIGALPKEVWVSFDIDGLDPRFCPRTGTPVPGGLDFHEANHLLRTLVRSGRKIVGFDLNEVAPHPTDETDDWDANVGARVLYKLTAWTLASQGKARQRA